MIGIAFDISYRSTGYCVFDFIAMKPIKTGYIKNTNNESVCSYLSRTRKHVVHLIETNKAEILVMEDLHMSFNKTSKQILQLHGVVKEVCHTLLNCEAVAYASQTWRHKHLGIKKFTKLEKEEITASSKTKAEAKRRMDIKLRVLEYVNKRLGSEYTMEQNDIVDAIGLCMAYNDEMQRYIK